MKALIETDGLTYQHPRPTSGELTAYDSTPPALLGVTLSIQAGEYVAIIGANGSGKTTFARHLNALLLPTSGKVFIDGLDTQDVKNHPAIRRNIGMVFQYPEDQIVATTVEEDVAFGPENMGFPSLEIQKRVVEAMRAVRIEPLRLRPPYQLSAGQVQRVALAGMLAMHPGCIVFDEATAMLDPSGRQDLLALIQSLHREGLTILYITHFMEEAAMAQRVIVFHEGQTVMDGTPRQIFSQAERLHDLGLEPPPATILAKNLKPYLPDLPTGILTLKELQESLPARIKADTAASKETNSEEQRQVTPALIEVDHLSHLYGAGTPFAQQALDQVSLSIEQGSLYGLIGATGSGKSTLLQHLNGLYLPRKGKVRVGPYHLEDPNTDLRAVRKMVGLVFQLPESQLFEQFVGDEIAFGPRRMGLAGSELRESVRKAMELVGLDFEAFKDRLTFTLSGGERRKVALASVIALNPQVLLLDEPTAGLDPIARREFLRGMIQMHDQGVTLVVSSHRMEDLAELSQAVTILNQGKVVLSGSAQQMFTHKELLVESGLRIPLVVQVADTLRKKNWPIPSETIRSSELIDSVASLSREGIHE